MDFQDTDKDIRTSLVTVHQKEARDCCEAPGATASNWALQNEQTGAAEKFEETKVTPASKILFYCFGIIYYPLQNKQPKILKLFLKIKLGKSRYFNLKKEKYTKFKICHILDPIQILMSCRPYKEKALRRPDEESCQSARSRAHVSYKPMKVDWRKMNTIV